MEARMVTVISSVGGLDTSFDQRFVVYLVRVGGSQTEWLNVASKVFGPLVQGRILPTFHGRYE